MNQGLDCGGWKGKQRPEGIICPPAFSYPHPPWPVKTLFLGWNPPGTTHFWNSNQDRLRLGLREVLTALGWDSNEDLIGQFLKRGCYLVHVVRCWPKAKFPDPHGELGVQLVATCARSLLDPTLSDLQPEWIVALGKVPHIALHALGLDVPRPSRKFPYTVGWHGTIGSYKIIITCFPNTWPIDRRKPDGLKNRDCTIAALKKWWGAPWPRCGDD